MLTASFFSICPQGGAALLSMPYSMSCSLAQDPASVQFDISPSDHLKVYVNGMESHRFSKLDDIMKRVVISHDGTLEEEREYLKYSMSLSYSSASMAPAMTMDLSLEPVADTFVNLNNMKLSVRSVSCMCKCSLPS